jgi:hypothetical protein
MKASDLFGLYDGQKRLVMIDTDWSVLDAVAGSMGREWVIANISDGIAKQVKA